jgi:hypothetical protein
MEKSTLFLFVFSLFASCVVTTAVTTDKQQTTRKEGNQFLAVIAVKPRLYYHLNGQLARSRGERYSGIKRKDNTMVWSMLYFDVNCRQLTSVNGGIFFNFNFFFKQKKINFVMVSICRETNSKIDGILFISSKCNLDLQKQLKGCFFCNFFRGFSIKHWTLSKVRKIIVFGQIFVFITLV